MAIFQVVDQDGQKALVEVPVGSDNIWGRYVPGVIPDNPAALIADLPVGAYVTDDKQLSARSVPAPYNTEEWITESGTWTAPVTGWYEVLLYSGGMSGTIDHATYKQPVGGDSGGKKSAIVYLNAGQQVPVVIGAGGAVPQLYAVRNNGGATSFGDITVTLTIRDDWQYSLSCSRGGIVFGQAVDTGGLGGGLGGGRPFFMGDTQEERNAFCSAVGHFGGGGGAAINQSTGIYAIGAGAPGSVRLRYYDPNKEVTI